MASVILGVFSERGNAEGAISQLESRGYNPKDMSFMMKDRSKAKELSEETGTEDIVEGTVGGATTGAILGGLAGLVASFVIPGLGAFFIGGPIAAALGLTGAAATTASGAVTGALAGGILGALTSAFNLSDEEARTYEQRINEGGLLVVVPVSKGKEREVKEVMTNLDADNVKMVETREKASRREQLPSRGSEESVTSPAYYSEVRRNDKKSRKSR